MAFIKAAMSEAKESESVPEGEYDLRVISSEPKRGEDAFKSGREGWSLLISIESAEIPNPAPVMHNLMLPVEDDKESTKNLMLLGIRRFLECFNIPYEDGGFDEDDLEGAAGRCLLRQVPAQRKVAGSDDKYEDIPGEFRNELVLPRLKSEASQDDKGKEKKKGPASKRR